MTKLATSALTVTGGQLVVDALRACRVRHVFGIPGGQTLAILDAIYGDPDVRFVTTRHEGAAACMADAVGRLTDGIGVCLATTGPGATNLLTGVGGALRDSSPVLVITCNNRTADLGRDDAQAADHVAIFRPLTKWATHVADAHSITRAVHEAVIRARSGCPGPVLVDFARNALEAEIEVEPGDATSADLAEDYWTGAWRQRPRADPELISAAAALLNAARSPVIWVGNGVQLSGAESAALALAETLHAPVVTTFNSLGAAETGHPNVFGPLSRMGTRLSRRVIDGCDLLLAVGNSLNAISTSRWRLDLPGTIIQIDTDPSTLGTNYPQRTLPICGDALAVLSQLKAAVSASPDGSAVHRASRLAELTVDKQIWWSEVTGVDMAQAPMAPAALVQALRQETPADAVLAVDAGNPGVWTHFWHVDSAGSYIKPVGFGNMGFAVPAAIAAKIVQPERPVVALVGDGALGMTMGELETVVREDLAVCIVVANDCGYGNIRQEELVHYGERYVGVDFVDVDYAAVARGFGIAAYRADSGEALVTAVREILGSGAPGLIDARIDPNVNAWTHPLLVPQG